MRVLLYVFCATVTFVYLFDALTYGTCSCVFVLDTLSLFVVCCLVFYTMYLLYLVLALSINIIVFVKCCGRC